MANQLTRKWVLISFAFLIGGCRLLNFAPAPPAPTPLPTPTAVPPSPTPEPAIGSFERPIRLVLAPAPGSSLRFPTSELLARALREVMGLALEVSAASTHREAIEGFCDSPETSIAFLTAVDFVLAQDLCAAETGAMATVRGYGWTAGMVFVPRESGWTSLADLNSKTWAFPSATSLESYLYPLHMFKQQGLLPVPSLEAGSDGDAVAAVHGGRADFGTAFYAPLWIDGKPADWNPGDPADVPEDLVRFCTTTADGKAVLCTNLHVRDARREIRMQFTDVVQKVRILATTPLLPNDAVVFGAGFPPELKQTFLMALLDFAARDPETFTRLLAPYGWTGLIAAADSDFEPARLAVGSAGIGLEDLDP